MYLSYTTVGKYVCPLTVKDAFFIQTTQNQILFYYILNVAKSEHISLYTCAHRKQRQSNVPSRFILCSLLGASSLCVFLMISSLMISSNLTGTFVLTENRGQTGNVVILKTVGVEFSKCNNTKILYIPEMQGFSLHIIKSNFVIN